MSLEKVPTNINSLDDLSKIWDEWPEAADCFTKIHLPIGDVDTRDLHSAFLITGWRRRWDLLL
ncbi:hypothetical protein J6590_061934 [Homalodisca vitripennis]|nr:hypothetical protein J6590_061934 [Homalodisca vitripennis]